MPVLNVPPVTFNPIKSAQQSSRMGQLAGPVSEPYNGAMPPGMIGQPYQPETGASDRLNQWIEAYPGFQEPGMLDKIIAGLASLKDPGTALTALHQQPALEEWGTMLAPLQIAAQEERYSNELGQRETSQAAGRELEAGRLDVSGARLGLDIERFEQELTPEEKNALVVANINLRNDNALSLIQVRAAESRATGDERHANALEAIANRAANAGAVEETRQTGRTKLEELKQTGRTELEEQRQERPTNTGSETSGQKATRLTQRAIEAKNNPKYAPYVNVGPEGDVTISVVGTGSAVGEFFGGKPDLSPELHNEIMQFIHGTSDGTTTNPFDGGPIIMLTPDGTQEGEVEPGEVKRLEELGYTRK